MDYYIIVRSTYDNPHIVGPFASYDEAEEYAVENHPDDEEHSVWIVQPREPVKEVSL